MWVRFLANFDYSPEARGGRVTVAYKAGDVCNVTRDCCAQALAKNVAILHKRNGQPDDGNS